jgi:hypothetical protein
MDWTSLQTRLEEEKERQNRIDDSSDGESEDSSESRKKKAEFAAKRKAHYNEGTMLRAAMSKSREMSDNEEDE